MSFLIILRIILFKKKMQQLWLKTFTEAQVARDTSGALV